MLKEFEPKLWIRLRQLCVEAHNCDGATNQDKEMCMAIYTLKHFYERTHEKAISAYLKETSL